MKVEGFQSWVKINQFNAIGIFEVLVRILKFVKLFKFIQRKILEFNPDILITIDSPSFSYRIVKRLQILRNKTKFIHYVAPTVWAWKSYRAKIFSELYDQMFTLFDFEPKKSPEGSVAKITILTSHTPYKKILFCLQYFRISCLLINKVLFAE